MPGIDQFLSQLRSGDFRPYYFVSHASADNAQIRPIIQILLDAGIPLWFDRPRDAGFDPDLFVGSLSANERWTDQLNEALAQSRGLIWFPSENYAQSDECKRERNCADMLKGIMTEFVVAGVCISADTFAQMDLREQTRQATRAFVEASGEAFKLDETYRPELMELASILQTKLADQLQGRKTMVDQAKRFDGTPLAATNTNADRVRDYNVPFRVDRTNQRYSVKDIYDDYLSGITQKRPIL
ncbi:MAG: toll/interleukin-1 receptor domain-containing protein, partial [Pseudomonadota bacterium]